MRTVLLAPLGVLSLIGCQEHPPIPAETLDQQRFMTGCRPADAARDPTAFAAYCDRF
ncbi:MAG TPA: hypothetical protein VKB68_03525 [Stellaceae bacterium]|nr:hypothetical protein [Stellaceae bacterium]